MWLPTFLQRGIHFFGERTEVLAFNNFVLFDRVHLPIIGKRAAVVEEDLLSVREPVYSLFRTVCGAGLLISSCEQHRVYRVVAHGVDLALLVAHD